jgi:ABC-type transport system substrate-binding protein
MRSIRVRDGCALAAWLFVASAAGCPTIPDGPRFEGNGHGAPIRGGTLMLWDEPRIRTLDPHVAFDELSSVPIAMLYDNLYGYDHSLTLVPKIAEALPRLSDEGKTLEIPLRRGVRFHHGRVVTAADVVWSFERMLQPSLHSPGAPYYRAIEGFDAYRSGQSAHLSGLSTPDAHTVRIRLKRADRSFVHTLAMHFSTPLPREYVERADADTVRRPIGTGPFRLISWDPGVRVVLERHAHYHDPARPYVDRVVFEEGVKRDTGFLRFRNGELDIAPRMTPPDIMLMRSARWRAFSAPLRRADIYGLYMNVELAPFHDVHVRRAVAFAIDRERWSRARNHAIRPAGQMLPPGIPGHDPSLPHRQRFDLKRAREEMRRAGHPNGLDEPVTLWINDTATGRAYGELAQADLAKIGIKLALKPVSFPVYLEETGKPKTAQMVAGGWYMDFPDASNFLHQVSSASKLPRDSYNRAFYSDPALDALLERALVEGDPEKRVALYREANDFVADAAPWAFFGNTQVPQAWQPYVHGYRPHPAYWMYVNDVWLDLPRRRIAALVGPLARDVRLAQLIPMLGGAR